MTISRLLLAAASFAAVANGSRFTKHDELSDSYSFEDFLRESGKTYADPAEKAKRMEIFSSNLKKIRSHNSSPSHSWKMGVNRFTDMTKEEVKSQTLGGDKARLHKNQKKTTSAIEKLGDKLKGEQLPASVDWRNIPNVISAVKDQGQCGSCTLKIIDILYIFT
jgi:hypothetical protein